VYERGLQHVHGDRQWDAGHRLTTGYVRQRQVVTLSIHHTQT